MSIQTASVRAAQLVGVALATSIAASTAHASHDLDGVVELSLLGAFPSGDYGRVVDDEGIGVDAMIGGRVADTVQLGLQLGWSRFGSAPVTDSVGHPFATVSDNTFMSHLVLRVQPRFGIVRPYVEGLLGARALFATDTGGALEGSSLRDTDWAASYGLGAGVGIRLLGGRDGPELSISAGLRHLWGSESTYLVVRDRYPDPTFEVRRSRTDVWQPRIGLSLSF